MSEIPVDATRWDGGKNQIFTFANDSDSDVRIVRTTIPFPFSEPSPIIVKAHTTFECRLINQAGSFAYSVLSVSGANAAGNPRNVVIS